MASEPTTTCPDCGLTYFYDPKHHECQTGPVVLAGETWVEECMRKQREGRS